MTNEPKPIAKLVEKTLATLGSQMTSKPKSEPSPTRCPESTPSGTPVTRPAKLPWERKWLQLDIHHPAVQKAADDVHEWAFRWFRNVPVKSLLVIHGDTGCGKTHIASKLAAYARAASFTAYEKGYWDSPPTQVALRWPECVASMVDHSEDAWVQDAIDAGFLWLDDIGAENDPWKKAADRLCQILSRRETRFTVITTNVASNQWPEKFDIRIADRLFRNAVVVDMSQVPSFTMR